MWLAVLLLFASMQTGDHASGVALYRQRDYAKAAEVLRRAVDQEKPGTPEYRESVVFLAQSYYLTARVAEAIPWLEKAIAEGVRTNEVQYMLGNAYVQNRESDKAVSAFANMFGF